MEIIVGLAALVAVWWVRSAMRTKRYQRAMALRRTEFHKRKDVFADTWEFDFVEMAMLYQYRVYDWPPVEANDLHALRRCGDSHWEVRLSPESAAERLRELDHDAKTSVMMSAEDVSSIRESIWKRRDEWTRLDDHMAAQLDTQYKLFLAGYEPVAPNLSLEALWARLTALKREEEKRASQRQEKAA